MEDHKMKATRCSVMIRNMIPLYIVTLSLLASLMAIMCLREVTWVSSFVENESNSISKIRSTTTRDRAETRTATAQGNDTILQNQNGSSSSEDDIIPLYIITAAARQELLTRGIFHVQALFECGFDVHWIIVHNFPDKRHRKVPLFSNVFPWITELFAYNELSDYGDHERNVGIEHVINNADSGLVYFLDDDNALSTDICRTDIRKTLRADSIYYGDQVKCKFNQWFLPSWRFSSQWKIKWTNNFTLDFTLFDHTDTANWLTPVWLFKQEFYGNGMLGPKGLKWKLQKAVGSDGLFFTDVVKAMLLTDGSEDRLVELPHYPYFRFHHNYLTECEKQIIPSGERDNLNQYRHVVEDMQRLRESPAKEVKMMMNHPQISFDDHAHILYSLRNHLQEKETAIYMEIGVWKGATSIFMSWHPLRTNVIGIDRFAFENQRDEAEAYVKHLKGGGNISWIEQQSDSNLVVTELTKQLDGSSIDILFFSAGQHSTMEGVMADFELYAPLVSEGGFIVFDGYMDTVHSAGVREAVLHLIRNGKINRNEYDVIGCLRNDLGAGPLGLLNDEGVYDWQSQVSNEFVLRKKNKALEKRTSEEIVRHIKGDGQVSWVKMSDDSKELTVPELRDQANRTLNGSTIDILFIAADQSMENIVTAFEVYAPLVSWKGHIVFEGSSTDMGHAAGVREAIKHLMDDGLINGGDYDMFGCLPNHGEGPIEVSGKHFYDWQGKVSDWFALGKG